MRVAATQTTPPARARARDYDLDASVPLTADGVAPPLPPRNSSQRENGRSARSVPAGVVRESVAPTTALGPGADRPSRGTIELMQSRGMRVNPFYSGPDADPYAWDGTA
jgi:hypothetical protein